MLDLVFVIDSSGSIQEKNPGPGENEYWNGQNGILQFVADFVGRLDIGENQVRVGVVKYSKQAINEIFLNRYYDKSSLQTAILNLKYIGGTTNTAEGIELMRTEQFTLGNGDRPNVPNVAVVITDGEANERIDDTETEARMAHSNGIKIYALGITNAVTESTLRQISSPPQQLGVTYFITTDFNQLQNTLITITTSVCSAACK